MDALKKTARFFVPKAQKSEDGRDQWGSRASFVLAAMGGAIGLGNLLRYPSQVFNNHGLQWFVPYLIALAFLGIPILILEIAIGQAYHGGCVIAYNHLNKRTKGVGLAILINGYMIVVYYVPILAWVMNYFSKSFRSPLPWTGRPEEFWMEEVIANVAPVEGTGSSYLSYPDVGLIGETTGWCAFTWFVTWLCMFNGVGITGRVVYFTMGLPIFTMLVLVVRSLSLPNASDGLALYIGQWNGGQLGNGAIWQSALGQIFFSIGVGMGYFTSYASYNSPYANCVQDALIIAFSNSCYEVFAALAVFGVVGNIGLLPGDGTSLGTFVVGFLTYPEAIANMPGANFWAVLFFFTLMLLGISSAFALLDAVVTLLVDTDWGRRVPRWVISTSAVVVSFLLSLVYCTRFGFYLLDAVDTYVNYLALFFVVWCECVASTTVYRYKDVLGQVGGWTPFAIYNVGYIGGMVGGVALGQAVGPEAGAGLGFGLYIVGTGVSVLLSRTPDVPAPSFWGSNAMLSRFWYLAFYSVSVFLSFSHPFLPFRFDVPIQPPPPISLVTTQTKESNRKPP